LDLGRGPVDLISQNDIVKDRALLYGKLTGFWAKNFSTHKVRGEEVWSKLDAFEISVNHSRKGLYSTCFREPRNALDQYMPPCKETDKHPFYQIMLTDKQFSYLILQTVNNEMYFFNFSC